MSCLSIHSRRGEERRGLRSRIITLRFDVDWKQATFLSKNVLGRSSGISVTWPAPVCRSGEKTAFRYQSDPVCEALPEEALNKIALDPVLHDVERIRIMVRRERVEDERSTAACRRPRRWRRRRHSACFVD